MSDQDPVAVRDHLIDSLRRELIGPDPGRPAVQWAGPGSVLNGEEILRPQDRPRTRYGAGILFPNGLTYSGFVDTAADNPESDAERALVDADDGGGSRDVDEGDDGDDNEPPVLNSFVPSSLGISFLADMVDGIDIEASWAVYNQRELPGWVGAREGRNELWFRTPHRQIVSYPSAETPGILQRTEALSGGGPKLMIVDRPWSGGRRLVTVTMLNDRRSDGANDTDCFFQCALRVRPTGTSVILPYPGRPDAELDEEERSLKLLYRHRPTFAVGHGCAADWRGDEIAGVSEVRSETLPVFAQHPIIARDRLAGADLSMLGLATAGNAVVVETCGKLVDAYCDWIGEQRAAAAESELSAELRQKASEHLDRCDESLLRMRAGIELLAGDSDVMTAFRWMNRAMVQQRSHYALSSEKEKRRAWVLTSDGPAPERRFTTPEYPHSVSWRPFQLAFVLMNLLAFVQPDHAERDIVDVIWFPTGGGKTEAYLGMAAWALLYRRMQNPRDGGVSVLMRYTLRLLTAQQFQRASSLICALELMRREAPQRFGDEPFTIGLWLGGSVTPNSDADAVSRLADLDNDEGQNPFVVLSCPWCGVEMGRRPYDRGHRIFGYALERQPARTVRFRCEDTNCPFSDSRGLPLEVVDERIYRNPPTLIIGTVDKFAMLPWNPEARRLFGLDRDVSPPDLIIQDELHLISGPLGSMVGHYETVIDELCTRTVGGHRIGPKIVASTATISHADDQVRALYARPARLFPAQALRAGDSFFAIERPDLPGRTYVGVLGSGLSSHVVAQIRVTAALLQAPANLKGLVPDEALDPYWSLITYFNSLRELGRASTLIQADIREYLNWIWQRTGISDTRLEGLDRRRFINQDVELTSRVPSTQIPEVLERLFTGLPDPTAVDVCFATNMIQVGLDVPRLSLMMIVGQPKGASEYIQASSRVGRDLNKPGLVVTNYNPFKPRDRSHFESFRQYHESIYRFVEPTSVTPFSLPVCERAIHALAVALIRCLEPGLRNDPAGGPSAEVRDRISAIIMRRVEAVASAETERASEVLREFFDDWDRKNPERYGDFSPHPDSGRPLMIVAGKTWGDGEDPIPRSTPSSMRSVDAESAARVLSAYLPEGI
jgi:hypothetical protein